MKTSSKLWALATISMHMSFSASAMSAEECWKGEAHTLNCGAAEIRILITDKKSARIYLGLEDIKEAKVRSEMRRIRGTADFIVFKNKKDDTSSMIWNHHVLTGYFYDNLGCGTVAFTPVKQETKSCYGEQNGRDTCKIITESEICKRAMEREGQR